MTAEIAEAILAERAMEEEAHVAVATAHTADVSSIIDSEVKAEAQWRRRGLGYGRLRRVSGVEADADGGDGG